MRAVSVALDVKARSIDNLYTYLVPDDLSVRAAAGCRVSVPFGRGNKFVQGIILGEADLKYDKSKLKKIADILDEQPLISNELCGLVHFVRERAFCTYFDAVKAMVPLGCRIEMEEVLELAGEAGGEAAEFISSHKRPTLDLAQQKLDVSAYNSLLKCIEKGTVVKKSAPKKAVQSAGKLSCEIAATEDKIEAFLAANPQNAAKYAKTLELLRENGKMSLQELCYLAAVTASVPKTMKKHGIIDVFEEQYYRNPYEQKKRGGAEPERLNPEQEAVFRELAALAEQPEAKAALLFGVTGSGKTVIYTSLCKRALEKNMTMIVLVPEISLTPQFTDRFYSLFGDKVAVLHSGLSMGERYDEWRRVKSGEARIVIGTRSAIFAPCRDIYAIIIDEEQEGAYKSESNPRYSARDIARYRAASHNCLMLLGSATPDIESYYKTKIKKYRYFELNSRYNKKNMPEIIVSDLRDDLEAGSDSIFGSKLREEIQKNLERKEQTILFLNRRGFFTHIGCPSCGYVAQCNSCSVAMTYHLANDRMVCHYCGHVEKMPPACPKCGARLKTMGIGTQRAADELSMIYPEARILRMDADTTMRKSAHDQMLGMFAAGEYDVLIGTQMVAKGLDLPNVTLVGVLFADSMLYAGDYRANERAYGMMTQVIGRAGRGEVAGRAVIQTYTPENRIFSLVAGKSYREFADEELTFRKTMLFPPYCDIYKMMFSSQKRETAVQAALDAQVHLEFMFMDFKMENVIMFPAEPAPIEKICGKYRARILLKCRDGKKLRHILTLLANKHYAETKNCDMTIERNPNSVL